MRYCLCPASSCYTILYPLGSVLSLTADTGPPVGCSTLSSLTATTRSTPVRTLSPSLRTSCTDCVARSAHVRSRKLRGVPWPSEALPFFLPSLTHLSSALPPFPPSLRLSLPPSPPTTLLFLQIDWKSRNVVVDTKLIPGEYDGRNVKFTLESIRKYLNIQLAAIKADSIPLWYLHAPDYTTPLEETVEAIKTLFEEGKFQSWGVSNYAAWQVQKLVDLSDKLGAPRPVAYQGIYNALHRQVEAELFPCLRANGLRFYEFNPLAGGVLTGALKIDEGVEKGSRFDPNTKQGQQYRQRYFKDEFFDAVQLIRPVAEKHNLTLAEVRFSETASLVSTRS